MERNVKHIHLWHVLRGFGSETRLVRPGRSGPNTVPQHLVKFCLKQWISAILTPFWLFWVVLPSDETCFRVHFRCIYGCLRYEYVILSVFPRFQGLGRPCKSGLSSMSASSKVVDFSDFDPFLAILGGTSLR